MAYIVVMLSCLHHGQSVRRSVKVIAAKSCCFVSCARLLNHAVSLKERSRQDYAHDNHTSPLPQQRCSGLFQSIVLSSDTANNVTVIIRAAKIAVFQGDTFSPFLVFLRVFNPRFINLESITLCSELLAFHKP